MIPWYAWAYLALLGLIGAGRFVLDVRARHYGLAVLRLLAIVVLGYAVLVFFCHEGADIVFAAVLGLAIAVLAYRSFADARIVRRERLAPAAQLGVALGEAALMPAAVLGILAFWMQRSG